MNFCYKIYLQFIFLLLCVASYSTAKAKAEKYNKLRYIQSADEALARGSNYTAIDLYLKVIEKSPKQKSIYTNLAKAYLQARDYEQATIYFNKAFTADSILNVSALYYAALCTKMQGKYTQAIPQFKLLGKLYKEDDAPKMKRWSRLELDGCLFALKELKPDPFVKLKHLGKEVNSNYGDMAPTLWNDQLYFSSINSDTVLIKNMAKNGDNEAALMKLYSSKIIDDVYSTKVQVKTFSQEGTHISNPAFSANGTRMVYTICPDDSFMPDCQIYYSKIQGFTFPEGELLNQEINLKGSTNTQPYLTRNSNGNEVLYFVSNRAGGRGGTDIWVSIANANGEFSTPRNLGSKINTDRNEVTPFFDVATATLYFSSNGWLSLGGSDIYKSQLDISGRFSNTAENLGAPFNSPCEDTYFRLGKNNEQGYLASNRPGVFSLRSATCCFDIFSFKYDRSVFLAAQGTVTDEETKQTLTGLVVNLWLSSNVSKEADFLLAADTLTNKSNFFFNLKPEKLYKLTAVKDGFLIATQLISTQGKTQSDTQQLQVVLQKLVKNKTYRLSNIYYDYDKTDLRPESKATLDTLYTFLINNSSLIIEISAHTDSRGSNEYNLNLSQKRAESCMNYLLAEKQIPAQRITAKGYGETLPIQDCNQVPNCPTETEGDCPCHQLNRRTEFKITGQIQLMDAEE